MKRFICLFFFAVSPIFLEADIQLAKVDSSGGILWNCTFELNNEVSIKDVQQVSDGGYVILVGCGVYNEDTVFVKSSHSISRSCSPNAIYYEDTVYQRSQTILLRIDSGGRELFRKSYTKQLLYDDYYRKEDWGWKAVHHGSRFAFNEDDQNKYESFQTGVGIHRVLQVADEGFIMYGDVGSSRAWIIRTDSAGEVLWLTVGKSFSSFFSYLEPLSDEGYTVLSNDFSSDRGIYLCHYKIDGNVWWKKELFGPEYNHELAGCYTADGGYILVAGNNTARCAVKKIDSTGSTIWSRDFGSDSAFYNLDSVWETMEGDFILEGCVIKYSQNQGKYYETSYNDMMKIDSRGQKVGLMNRQNWEQENGIPRIMNRDGFTRESYVKTTDGGWLFVFKSEETISGG